MRNLSYLLILIVLALTMQSCRPLSEVTYFQPFDSTTVQKGPGKVIYPNFNKDTAKITKVDFEATIQPHDIISIFVNSLSPEASSFFNTMSITERPQSGDNFTTRPNVGYLVDAYGDIEMPLVGKMHIGGYTTQVARDTIASRLDKFLQYPTVRLYIENFRVTILGEVYRPGVYSVTNEKITIPEALGQAGDMTIYGNRKKVLLIREENGIKSYINVDITRRDLFSSPYYYLHSGDILYVTPVRDRVASADNFYRITPIIIAALTLLGVIALRFAGK